LAEVVLFHHAMGLTPGVIAFADRLRAAGHTVHTPDLYEGKVFATLDEGVHHGDEELGMDEVVARARRAADALPDDVVYAGFSLGSVPAQALAQTRPGARGALLFHGGGPLSWFETGWPEGVPLQVHVMERDPWYEPDVVAQLIRDVPGAELFLYPGDRHLFADETLPDYDPKAAALLMERVLKFLGE
jgi:dienelactone hydrolase